MSQDALFGRLVETLAELRFTENHLGGIEVDWAGSDTQAYWRDEARRELAREGVGQYIDIIINPVVLSPEDVARAEALRSLAAYGIGGFLDWIVHETSPERRMALYRAVVAYDPQNPPTPQAVAFGPRTMEGYACRHCWHDAEPRAELTATGFWLIWWCPRCKAKL